MRRRRNRHPLSSLWQLARQGRLVFRDPRVCRDPKDCLDPKDPLVLLDRQALRGHRARQEFRGRQHQVDNLDPLGHPGLPDPKDLPGLPDRKDRRGSQAIKDHRVRRVPLVPEGKLAQSGRWDQPVR